MDPFSTPGEVILKLRGYSLPNKNHQYTMFTDENNQYVNTGPSSPNSNKIIELNTNNGICDKLRKCELLIMNY